MKKSGILVAMLVLTLAGCRTPPVAFRGVSYNDILLSCGEEKAILAGANILNVHTEGDKYLKGRWIVSIELNAEGSRQFGDITGRNLGKKLTLSVGGRTILAATIAEPIPGGKIDITGYSRDEAADIVAMFRKN